jgi:hypothetical protein
VTKWDKLRSVPRFTGIRGTSAAPLFIFCISAKIYGILEYSFIIFDLEGRVTSAGTYWSTAVATVAQQIQMRTRIDRIRVVVRIQPGSQGFLERGERGMSDTHQ